MLRVAILNVVLMLIKFYLHIKLNITYEISLFGGIYVLSIQ